MSEQWGDVIVAANIFMVLLMLAPFFLIWWAVSRMVSK